VIFRIANAFMLILFLFSVAAQYNDPDPVRWMTIYGLAAACCILEFAARLRWPVPAIIGAAAFIWAAAIAPHLIGQDIPMREVFGTMHMITIAVEETREMLGLLIVAGWMLALTVRNRRSLLQVEKQTGS
jgi:hypothetical protein